MPWSKGPVDERMQMIQLWLAGVPISTIASMKKVTRPCVYKWIERYLEMGPEGLTERSRAPESNPRKIPDQIVAELIELRKRSKACGPSTLADVLNRQHGRKVISRSSAAAIVAKHGLARKRRRRHRGGVDPTAPAIPAVGPGHTMTADHKGKFRLGNGQYCHALTIADLFSRYVYAIDASSSTGLAHAMKVFERVFREWGIPEQLLTDNGTPFCAAKSLGGLTQLSKYWLKLGIQVRRIDPGKPQQNGVHERMHRTLKQAVCREPACSLRGQQRLFAQFPSEYNEVRPHRGLDGRVPAEVIRPSAKPYPRKVEIIDPDHFLMRRVRNTGQFKWKGELLFLSLVLIDEYIGLELVDEALWDIYFGPQRLALFDESTGTLTKAGRSSAAAST
ncbi:MAG TPA: integrase core domain-containing protein [Thermoanaerobaculia bacterium]|nr:integrase core domain-containing protein [Thermoanaerobaculia bacterium]